MEYKFQAIMWAKGAKIGAQTGDIKMDFKEKLPKNIIFQNIVGLLKIVAWFNFWTSEIIKGDKKGDLII